MNGLDNGSLRVAEPIGKHEWKVNQWLKKSVLLSFRLNDMGGPEDQFREWCKQPETDIDTSKSNNFRHSKEEYMYGGKSDKD